MRNYLDARADAATLAFFRIAFGLMMFGGIVRFALLGWIEKLYLRPSFHFSYYFFEWVKPFGNATYLLFALCGISALMMAAGYLYRFASVAFFLSFTYIELMDKTTYLNHYYFISVVAFVMMFLPAGAYFSVDAKQDPSAGNNTVPRYTVDILKILVAVVYIYAGVAKLNSDWLVDAMPLKIWLSGKTDIPVIGALLGKTWVAYLFSYVGAFYDLLVVFLLLNRKTRWTGFVLVVAFHLLTSLLFPIGIFPYVMIVSAFVFFSSGFHRKILRWMAGKPLPDHGNANFRTHPFIPVILGSFLFVQLLFPFRYLLYPTELFWTEEGFRFSWRVMLMEKAGYTQFRVVDAKTKAVTFVRNGDFLTPFQEKQMAFQPDFILEYAHYLHDIYARKGMSDPEVYVESYVALNGRLSKPYIDPNVNLAQQHESFSPKSWILPFGDASRGF